MSKLPSYEEASRLLRKAGCEENVVNHSTTVSRSATKLALACAKGNMRIDVDLVKVGGLLHDIGRSLTHDVRHGVKGAEIAQSLKLPDGVVRIIASHVGAGIPKKEAEALGLPPGDYLPLTPEEKIVCYTDKLIKRDRRMSFQEAWREMARRLGPNHPALERFAKLHEEITKMTRGEKSETHANAEDSTKQTRGTAKRGPR